MKKTETIVQPVKKGRGRPKGTGKKQLETKPFDVSCINVVKGNNLNFSDNIFIPMATESDELNTILSTKGGLMPATNMVLVGGPGSGKTTVVLDMLSGISRNGKKVLFISGEMDEIGYFKMCKRLPHFGDVPVLFLKEHADNVKEVMEHVFQEGYDVIAIDSLAEVIEMYKAAHKCSKTEAETWLIIEQDKAKLAMNKRNINTSFVNIQQQTKGGDFVGSNRIKHMTDAMSHLEVSAEGERTMHFSKNRDCDKNFKIRFSFFKKNVFYSFQTVA